MSDKYVEYVEHPRYGKLPHYTGLDPACHVSRAHGGNIVSGTAIEADMSKQLNATVPIPYYFDIDQLCRECGRRFIFFAKEQKHWYEKLGFYLWSFAVRCPTCRQKLRSILRLRQKYEKLTHLLKLNAEEALDMAKCCVTLMEEGVFNVRQTEHVRAILNQLPEDRRDRPDFKDVETRLFAIEKKERS